MWSSVLSFAQREAFFCFLPDNPRQSSHVPVFIRLLDINDNAPTFATVYETFVCERTKAGQVLQLYHFVLLGSRNIVLYILDRQAGGWINVFFVRCMY